MHVGRVTTFIEDSLAPHACIGEKGLYVPILDAHPARAAEVVRELRATGHAHA